MCIRDRDRAYDNKSPVGAMFVGNNEFGMNQPGIGYEATQARALSANELPDVYKRQLSVLQMLTSQ